jgi:hypothetical protein
MHFYCRVQQESSDGAERNRFLVNYVDFAFDDFGDRQTPVYPGLSTVWGSLARSKVNMDFLSLFEMIMEFILLNFLLCLNFMYEPVNDSHTGKHSSEGGL